MLQSAPTVLLVGPAVDGVRNALERDRGFELRVVADPAEAADQFGVAAPTFHEHVRRIERELLQTFFEALPPSAGVE